MVFDSAIAGQICAIFRQSKGIVSSGLSDRVPPLIRDHRKAFGDRACSCMAKVVPDGVDHCGGRLNVCLCRAMCSSLITRR